MRIGTSAPWWTIVAMAAGMLAGCVTAKGASYAETLASAGKTPGVQARIVVLRPDQRYDDSSLNRMVIRIDEHVRGKLAYGGFLLTDVAPGDRTLQVSADNLLFGTCTLALRLAAGDVVYFDASPRPANIAAGVVGGTIGSLIEGAGPGCKGPYRLTPLEPAVALGHLGRLRASE